MGYGSKEHTGGRENVWNGSGEEQLCVNKKDCEIFLLRARKAAVLRTSRRTSPKQLYGKKLHNRKIDFSVYVLKWSISTKRTFSRYFSFI